MTAADVADIDTFCGAEVEVESLEDASSVRRDGDSGANLVGEFGTLEYLEYVSGRSLRYRYGEGFSNGVANEMIRTGRWRRR